ncbi:MAG: helix-turn-helix domain-containing protein [Mariniblastus sp.]|nr:helix-turn-helix domain-containing protein [Mariniblastus sp.]
MVTADHDKERPIVHSRVEESSFEKFYSPVKVAKAIGVSESSVKRWCDSGKIAFSKTAGGHRRLNRAQIVTFLRDRACKLIKPTLVGLPESDGLTISNSAEAMTEFHSALRSGNEARCRRILLHLFVNGWQMEEIADQVVGIAMRKIGSDWKHGAVAVYEERRACGICLHALHDLRSMIMRPVEGAPVAIGGTVSGDNYRIPTFCVELTLSCHGWQATSLGSDLPFETLLQAAGDLNPDLMWLSASHLGDETSFVTQLNRFALELPEKTILVVGGYAITPLLRTQIKNAICCDNMSQLVASIRHLNRLDPKSGGL